MTDIVTARLAEWEALTEGATEGPWEHFSLPHDPEIGSILRGDSTAFYLECEPSDAEFIAAARTAMPALIAFVREVRALHVREPYADEPSEGFCRNCQHCGAAGTWPCPTEQAARKWLGGAP